MVVIVGPTNFGLYLIQGNGIPLPLGIEAMANWHPKPCARFAKTGNMWIARLREVNNGNLTLMLEKARKMDSQSDHLFPNNIEPPNSETNTPGISDVAGFRVVFMISLDLNFPF